MINYNENENEKGSYEIRLKPRDGHQYTKYKKCISMVVFISNKHHLSQYLKTLSNTEVELKKKALLIKKVRASKYLSREKQSAGKISSLFSK